MIAALLLPISTLFAAMPTPEDTVREPAVAGLFYPASKAELSAMIDGYLAAAAPARTSDGKLRAIICPHAGYVYSAPIAAQAYRLVAPDAFDTVVILAPTHTSQLRKAAVSDASAYRTPLGDMKISAKSAILAKLDPFALQPRCFVQRPGWWEQARKIPPMPHDDRADTWEHSGEVQVPFLQKTLPKAELVSVVMGELNAKSAAKALAQVIDDRTLLVISTDLSHYHPYAEARILDRATVNAICRLDADAVEHEGACGRIPIQTLIHLAKAKGWKARLLDLRNSGDTAGDKSRVVGYASIAFYEGGEAGSASTASPAFYSPEERNFLLGLARKSLTSVVTTGKLPDANEQEVPEKLRVKRGCFVTLTIDGRLRGCIGHIVAQEPLYRAVITNARNAALEDPRFPSVSKDELEKIEIEVSVLTAPQPLFFSSPEELLESLTPHRDGVVLQIGRSSATYLPQVWDQFPDKTQFLDSLAMKAGSVPGAWRGSDTKVYLYQDEAFKESSGAAKGKTP